MNYNDLKKVLFRFDPEVAHTIAEFSAKNIIANSSYLLKQLSMRYKIEDKRISQHILGTTFKNPVGIGAGFDKNATMVKTLEAIGFGAVEFGTLTPMPQEGNPKPRLFRYPEANSIQNAMGFNNQGSKHIKNRVKDLYPYKIPLGANIGKNKATSQEDAIKDYEKLILDFCEISDYIVINISSPNTPGLRDLQNEEFIKSIFEMGCSKTQKPILLKIAPDLETKDAIDMCQIALDSGASGIIATNTTIDYSLLAGAKDFGGVSGEVLKEKSFKLFQALAQEFYGKTTLISVGGIDSGEEAYRRIKAGASLVQVLSALIFKGPSLVKDINQTILSLMDKDGYYHISEAIGADLR